MTKTPPKIFCIGLGKTGTSTFAQCARVLGYRHRTGPIFHGLSLYRLGDMESLREIARGHDSFDDFPWPLTYREMARDFPDARFVLTRRRDSATWFRSLAAHDLRYGPREAGKLAYGYYEQRFHPEEMTALYDRHLDEVRAFFEGSGRLLEVCWEEGDGWAELCAFLAHDLPDDPFPRMNTATGRSPRAIVDGLCAKGMFAAAIAYAEDQPDREALRAVILHATRADMARQDRRARLYDATKGRLSRLLRKLKR
jgi:hypothetical protein